MGKTRLLVVAIAAAAVMVLGASAAFAGEVKGPPYTGPSGGVSGGCLSNQTCQPTGAEGHANSFCSFSGLNDHDSDPPGNPDKRTQTPADAYPGSPAFGVPAGGGLTISCNPQRSDIPTPK